MLCLLASRNSVKREKNAQKETRTETSIMSDRGSGRCQAKLGSVLSFEHAVTHEARTCRKAGAPKIVNVKWVSRNVRQLWRH